MRDLAVLDVDELAAADGAVRADRLDDVVGLVDPRPQRPRALRLRGAAEAERVALAQLAEDRPAGERLAELHERNVLSPPTAKPATAAAAAATATLRPPFACGRRRRGALRVGPPRARGPVLACERQHLRGVQRAPAGLALLDLRAAREPVRDDQRVGRRLRTFGSRTRSPQATETS